MTLEMMYLAMYGLVLMTTILIQVLISASQHGLLTLLGNRENLSSVGGTLDLEYPHINSLLFVIVIGHINPE